MELIYNNVTLRHGDMELHIQRMNGDRWRLYAELNYITIAPVVWTYDETVTGEPEQVYQHAVRRLQELARLKPIHDAVHDRVRRMSEGAALAPDRKVVRSIADASPDNPVLLRGGHETTDPRLDRIPEWDPRNDNFRMAAPLEAKEYKPRSYTWAVEDHLDQGNEGSCVGFAWAHELLARPKAVDADYAFARWIYKTAQRYDAWSGEAYEGTSVLAGAKVIQQFPPRMSEGRGLIGEYRWIRTLDELIRTLGYFGPVVAGTWWYEGMFNPDGEGFVKPTGYRAGGHAWLLKGVSLKRKAFRGHNSWGADWGQGGDFWIAFTAMEQLLAEQGELCVPMRRHSLED